MPLDHYVSQVHLKRFYSPVLGNRLNVIRKSDLEKFAAPAKDLCRIEGGSTNSFLDQPRAVEEILKFIEPKYNASVEKLIAGEPDPDCILAISGFAAYIISCSPTGQRIHSEGPKSLAESTGKILEAKGLLPPIPKELGESFARAVESGKIKIVVDGKFPQALGICSMGHHVSAFGNFKWEILINRFDDNPFFTSDFPIVIEPTRDRRILNRILSLAPNVALRVRPDPKIDPKKLDFSFSNFGFRRQSLSFKQVQALNREFVRCAHDCVFYRDDYPWVETLVKRNRNYWIEPFTLRWPTDNGWLSMFSQRISETRPAQTRS